MSVFSIILLSLLALYVAFWAIDRWVVTPKRERKTLPDVLARLDELEKKVEEKSDSEA